MTRYIVTNVYDGLNLRGSPSASGDLIGTMPFATVCDELEPSATKWKKVRATFDGATKEGYASNLYMTELRSDAIARLLGSVMYERPRLSGRAAQRDRGTGEPRIGKRGSEAQISAWTTV
jgi:hypothetical protein